MLSLDSIPVTLQLSSEYVFEMAKGRALFTKYSVLAYIFSWANVFPVHFRLSVA